MDLEFNLTGEPHQPVIVLRAGEAGAGSGESGGEEFRKFEDDLAAALNRIWQRAVDKVLPSLNEVWGDAPEGTQVQKTGEDPAAVQFSTERLANALERIGPLMALVMETEDEAVVRVILDGAMLRGSQAAKARTLLEGFARRNAILDGMVRSAAYYSNNYFNRFVMPGIWADVERMLDSNAPNSPAAYREIQARMAARLRTVPYWRTVANAAVSRAYHYGVVRGGMLAGYTGYRFVAVIDQRTTLQCRSYNGTEFWLADVSDLVERIAAAEGPDEIRQVAPWTSESEFRGLSEQEIRSRGPVIPPLHGGCRSTIELLS